MFAGSTDNLAASSVNASDTMTSSSFLASPEQHSLALSLVKAEQLHLLTSLRPSSRSGAESSPEPPHDLHLPTTPGMSVMTTNSISGSNPGGRLDTPIEELMEEDEDATLEPIMVKLDITRKQCPSLVVEGFKFTRSRSSHAGPSTFWRCSKRSCRATATSWGDDGLVQVKSVRMVHNHPPPEPSEFLVENMALEPGRQQMARVSRVLEPPRSAGGRKRPASSIPNEFLLDASNTIHNTVGASGGLCAAQSAAGRIVRRKSGGPQRNCSSESTGSHLSSANEDIGVATATADMTREQINSNNTAASSLRHVYGTDYQLNFSLNPPVFGPPVPHSAVIADFATNSQTSPKCNNALNFKLHMPTAVTHPITAQLLSLGGEESSPATTHHQQSVPQLLPVVSPVSSSAFERSALMQPIQGHAPSLGAMKTEATKPSPLKPVAPVTGSIAVTSSSLATSMSSPLTLLPPAHLLNQQAISQQFLNNIEHAPSAASLYSAPAQILRMWSELGCHPMLQGQLAPAVMQQMQQMQQAAMGAATMSNFPISVFNPPRVNSPTPNATDTKQHDSSHCQNSSAVKLDLGQSRRTLDDEWAAQRNRLLILVADIMRWAAENFGASPRLARINTNFSAIIESIAKAD